jgi:hemerythrin-like metal-binding protein
MTSIKWDDKYKIGVKSIDKQHKHFVGLINTLYEYIESRHTERIPEIINDLSLYAEEHFKLEEKYFDEFNYVDSDAHKAAHNELRLKVRELNTKRDNPKDLAFDLLYFMEKWLLVHFRGMDKKYVETFKQHGLK